ncbi:HAD family hydrolase [Desulfobulbus alkaliphilus]|uniref:HAD family hydrolase n=1 Tax=Desulfobulbus alkaliphilus TaxID=869814 RepID=UPI001966B29D|nr:beta-phosphoglucomutase family hydrolase [Desulfobulbus alkaliphilus]MBM9536069.1 beta-phosphoglucomutase family hydrolase [Desulfobulbus alkaliphilus]
MPPKAITRTDVDAVLFDLDGVVTETAKVHSVCWKKAFDDFLEQHAQQTGQPFTPFDISSDYNQYVDGKLRQEGVRSFLASRNIELPYGDPEGPSDQATVWGIGKRKDEMFTTVLREQGVDILEDGMALVRHVRALGCKTAVVSSSKNCLAVLKAAGIEEYFDVRVDGTTVDALGINGKPAPDSFLKAAELLGVSPDRSVVVEDAIAGVQAGKSGNFGLVVGVARKGDEEALRANGADIVVTDLQTLIV